jgi:hypothetical protein
MCAKSCEITGGCCGLARLSFGFIFHPSSRGAPLIVSLGGKTLALLLHSRHLAPAAKHQNNKFQFPPGDFLSIYELEKNAFACALNSTMFPLFVFQD